MLERFVAWYMLERFVAWYMLERFVVPRGEPIERWSLLQEEIGQKG